jgi:hypothetical protein
MPKPATTPAKRKAGQPRRPVPRTRTLPRVSEATHAALTAYAEKHGLYLADAVEAAAKALSGDLSPPPRASHPLARGQRSAH